jgi:ATP-dependent Clp protease ATP-binding subunit ClpC
MPMMRDFVGNYNIRVPQGYREKSRRTIFFARYEACLFCSPYIETEHLLLGLLRENKVIAASLGSDSFDSIRKQLKMPSIFHKTVTHSLDLLLSDECKRVLAYAGEEAENLSHKFIGTEHLLLGLLREENCLGAHLLKQRGVSLDGVRADLTKELK